MKTMNYADDDEKEKQLINQLHEVVSDYLNEYVLKPSMETIKTDIVGQARLAKLIFVTNHAADLVNKEGLTFDKEYFSNYSPPCQISDVLNQ